jgi:3-phenylpropionate/cinnamic acid dioxygenase small subunit
MTTLSDESTTAPPDAPGLEEVRAFIYREGRLLDEGRFDDWLTLWADDGCYWVPIGPDDSSPLDHVSIIHDDRQRIGQRVRRLNSEYAWAHVPQTLSARVISNIELRPELSDATKPEMVVSASMLVGEFREDRQELYCGRLEYRLRREPAGIRMVVKKVSLINRAGPLRNISAVL